MEKRQDSISRQAAIDALKKISFSHWFECGEYLSEDAREIEIISSSKALEVIEALPPVQPERKKGRWLYNRNEDGWKEWWTCDQCGKTFSYAGNFCPNCGAKMKG